MATGIDPFPLGLPYAMGDAIYAALRGAPALQGARVLDNPVRRADIQEGERIVFFEDVGDQPRGGDKDGNRTYSFNVCAINRSEQARSGSHADYRAAKRAVRAALSSLPKVPISSVLREGAVTYRLENIDVGGSLVLGTFSVDYRDPTPASERFIQSPTP